MPLLPAVLSVPRSLVKILLFSHYREPRRATGNCGNGEGSAGFRVSDGANLFLIWQVLNFRTRQVVKWPSQENVVRGGLDYVYLEQKNEFADFKRNIAG